MGKHSKNQEGKRNVQSRLLELDALRGIAALAVVIYHYTTRYAELYGFDEAPSFSMPLGHFGVQLFFVVSGFVIFLTLKACKHPLDFIASRFARLYPVYWAAVAVSFSSVTVFGLTDRSVAPSDALFNLTMLQGFVGIPNVEGVYWTLKWELVFYFWMFVFFNLRWEKYILWICFGWLLIQLGVWVFEEQVREVPSRLQLVFLIRYCNLFAAGIIFYRIKNGLACWQDHVLLLFSLHNQWLLHDLEAVSVTAGIFAVFYLFSFNRLSFITIKPLCYLGTISYSLYLIHEYMGWIFMRELLARGVDTDLTIGLALLLALGLASTLTYGVEKPAMARVRNMYKGVVRPRFVKRDVWYPV